MDVLCIISVVHHSHLDRNVLLLCLEIDNIIEEVLTMAVNVTNELLQTILSMEDLCTCLACLWVWTKVGKCNLNTSIEISQLTHTACYD